MTQVNLSLSKIYQALCPECKEKVVNLVRDAMTEQAIKDTLEGKVEPKKEG